MADMMTASMRRMIAHGMRRVRLVLCDADEHPLGALPPFEVDSPWWADVDPVTAGAWESFDIDLLVLRLLRVEEEGVTEGGEVTYLAEVSGSAASPDVLLPIPRWYRSIEEPLRSPWARAGGLRAIIGWADDALGAIGRPRTDDVRQVKSWNLSSVLALPTATGRVWCKSVPSFLADEGAVLALIGATDPSLAPAVLASSAPLRTVLLQDLGDRAMWDAVEPELLEMVEMLVDLQARWAGRAAELLGNGLPDWRARTIPGVTRAFMRRADVRATTSREDPAAVDALVADLPRRLAALAACGIPETLVHGDFHPGNWHAFEDRLVLLDWGDCAVGHPLLDMSAFLERVPDASRQRVRDAWMEAWQRACPQADVGRAADLVGPIVTLRRAMIYRGFLDGIEPSERRYHERDVPAWLRATARLIDR